MSDETQDFGSSPKSLDDLLAECIAAEESGRPIDRAALLRQHPQHASQLREFLANRDQMRRLAEPLQGAAAAAARRRSGHPLEKIRYFGDYELLDEIAAGGMGIVYKARQVSLNRVVAVKMILKGTLASDDDVKRFRAEAEAAANLQHPGIVAIHEVGLHDGQHYFSMDFVEGQSLAQLPREQPLSARQAAEYVRDAAEAVHYAHQQGTLHRDLKPSNILIDRQGRVRITDFGLAKRIAGNSDLTLTGQVLGTPAYMPPEQALSKRSLIGTASDVYSLGAVFYELLTGRPPFRGESPGEILRQVETLDPISPRLLSPATPRDLETICLKCLEKEPHKRYGTAQLMADDLNRFFRGDAITARPIGQLERMWRWCKRQPMVASLIAVVVALLVSGIGASSYFAVRASSKAASETQQRQRADREVERATTALREEAEARAREEERRVEAERARANSEWNLYLARMRTMLAAWTNGQFGQLQRILEEAVPKAGEIDYRGWEYYFLQDEMNKYAYVLPVPRKQRFAKWLAWSPDGTHLATSSGGVEIWQSEQRRFVRQIGGEFEGGPVAWRPDGNQMAIANDDGTIRIWNPLSGDFIRDFPAHNTTLMRCLVWSPNGKMLASGDGMHAGLKVWDAATGTCVLSLIDSREDDWIYALDWHPDGKRIISAQRRGRVRIWDTTTGETTYDRKINEHSTRFADWSPDGTLLAIGGGAPDYSIIIADHEGRESRRLASNVTPTCGSWSNDGRQFAVGTRSQQLHVWDVAAGTQIQAPNLHSAQLRQAVWSPNGELIATSTDDKLVRLVRRQALNSDSDATGLPHLRRPIWSRDDQALTGFTSDGKLICAGIADQVIHETIAIPDRRIRGFQYSSDGLWIAAWESFNSYHAWIHESQYAGPKIPLKTSNFAVSPDGKQLMAQELREVTKVWDSATGRLQFSMYPDLFQFAWSPDGSMIAIGGTNPRIEFWSPKSGKLLFRLPSEHGIEKVVWRNDGAMVAAITTSGSLSIFDVVNRKSLPTIWGHSDIAKEIAWSKDGRRIATGDNIGTVKIWDAATGAELLSFPAHKQAITALQWSSDSRRLLSADSTDEVRIWGSSKMPAIPTSNIDHLKLP